jgi:hypothetical protein
MVEIFGEPASAITVGELLRMASGLGVNELVPFNSMTWSQSRRDHHQVFPPSEYLWAVQCQHFNQNTSADCASPRMDCRPGPCRQYSSANFQVLGLVLLRHDVAACANLSWNPSLPRSSMHTHLTDDPPADDRCSWQNLSVRAVFERSPTNRYPRTQFYNAEPLNEWLTVAGWDTPNSDGNGPSPALVRIQDLASKCPSPACVPTCFQSVCVPIYFVCSSVSPPSG